MRRPNPGATTWLERYSRLGHQLTQFVIHYGIIALLLLTLVKGVGIPIPIPADLVILAAASGSASGKLVWWESFTVVLAGMVIGGLLQFLLVRGPARDILYRYGGKVGLTPHRLDLAFRRVENVGVMGVAVAVVTPAIRTAAIPACGIVRMRLRTFAAGLVVGTAAYIALQFFVAYGVIRFALSVWNHQDKAWLWLALVPIAALSGWMVYFHRTRHLSQLQGSLTEEDEDLRSHKCPLCLITVIGDRLSHPDEANRTGAEEPTPTGTPRRASAPSDSR